MFSLKNIFHKAIPQDPRYEDNPLFAQKELLHQIERKGYALGGKVLEADDLQKLNKIFDHFIEIIGPELPDTFFNSGRNKSVEARKYVTDEVHKIVQPKLLPFFNSAIADVMKGAFQVKPPGSASQLDPHQDSTIVDESQYFGVYAWIPLVDTDATNGMLYVLPGSHKFGVTMRSLNVPWPLMPLREQMFKHMIPVPLKAGEVVFFDHACVHYSPPNHGDKLRVAVTATIKPKAASMIHHFIDEVTPKGMVEIYATDEHFWNEFDIMKRPPSQFPLLATTKFIAPEYSPSAFEKLCKKYR
jgi:Phytanoyl-CoA dioxygenase (PhyH)